VRLVFLRLETKESKMGIKMTRKNREKSWCGWFHHSTDCDYLVYVYRCNNIKVVMLIHVDDLLIVSNSHDAIWKVKSNLASHFKIHDQGPTTSILSIKIERDCPNQTISLSQPSYIESILEQFGMSECNPALTLMEENQRLSASMSLDMPE
jgi:hypothetical protein